MKYFVQEAYMNDERHERLLLRWVNLPDMPRQKDLAALGSIFPKLFHGPFGEIAGGDPRWKFGIRKHLRAVWDAPTRKEQLRIIFATRDLFRRFARMNDEQMRDVAFKQHVLAGKPAYSNLPREAQEEVILKDLQREAERQERLEAALSEKMKWGLLVEPPPEVPSSFDPALDYLESNLRRALHCPNAVCKRPYFFKNEGKRTQRYCSEKCSHAARLETKAQWWNEKGKINRQRAKGGK
jgi:hypothetical protein